MARTTRSMQVWAAALVLMLASSSVAQARAPRKLLWDSAKSWIASHRDALAAALGVAELIETDGETDGPPPPAPLPGLTNVRIQSLEQINVRIQNAPGSPGGYGTYGSYGDADEVFPAGEDDSADEESSEEAPVRRLLRVLASEGNYGAPGSYGGYGNSI